MISAESPSIVNTVEGFFWTLRGIACADSDSRSIVFGDAGSKTCCHRMEKHASLQQFADFYPLSLPYFGASRATTF